MVRPTPFHERLREYNQGQLWTHWSGRLSALRYDLSAKHEYFAIRNSVGVFDASPLYKYWVRGEDAERFLAGVLTRDIRLCAPGRAHYTVWCDDRGFVQEDGVFFRHSETEFLMTCARPNLGYFSGLVGRLDVEIEDVSDAYGILAVQGPRSREVLALLAPEVDCLAYFSLCHTSIGSTPVTISRTGYTGDLGFEVFVPADDAVPVLDAVLAAGAGRGLRLFGEEALLMARIEAGLVLIDVDFRSSRFAFTDQQRFTPKELGFGWMLRGIDSADRPFIGRDAIRGEIADKRSRWAMVGVVIDWQHYNRLYAQAGLLPPKEETPLPYESMVYDDAGQRLGYVNSLMYSPVLQRHIGMARIRPEAAAPGAHVNVEITIDHEYRTVGAQVARLPLFNPQRKTA
jgi:aminomethyltransferase